MGHTWLTLILINVFLFFRFQSFQNFWFFPGSAFHVVDFLPHHLFSISLISAPTSIVFSSDSFGFYFCPWASVSIEAWSIGLRLFTIAVGLPLGFCGLFRGTHVHALGVGLLPRGLAVLCGVRDQHRSVALRSYRGALRTLLACSPADARRLIVLGDQGRKVARTQVYRSWCGPVLASAVQAAW